MFVTQICTLQLVFNKKEWINLFLDIAWYFWTCDFRVSLVIFGWWGKYKLKKWKNCLYTAKLLFHQSPTRHSDYTVTWWWWCSHCCNCRQHGDYNWSTVWSLCCLQLSTVTTPLPSSHCVVTVPSRWLMEYGFAVYSW